VQRDIEDVERYSQEEATKRLLKALHESHEPSWLHTFKHALARERNALMSFSLLNLPVNGQVDLFSVVR